MSKIFLCQSHSHTTKGRRADFDSSSQKSQSPVPGSILSELLETWNIMVAGVCEGYCAPYDRQETESEITSKVTFPPVKYHLLMFLLSSRTASPGNQMPNIVSLWEGVSGANKYLPHVLAIPLDTNREKVKSYIHLHNDFWLDVYRGLFCHTPKPKQPCDHPS